MIIKNWKFKNFKSWGNTWTEFNVNPDGGLSLVAGVNESGKCLSKNTNIEIDIESIVITNGLVSFLETTKAGTKIKTYIKENNPLLYEKIYRR